MYFLLVSRTQIFCYWFNETMMVKVKTRRHKPSNKWSNEMQICLLHQNNSFWPNNQYFAMISLITKLAGACHPTGSGWPLHNILDIVQTWIFRALFFSGSLQSLCLSAMADYKWYDYETLSWQNWTNLI